MKGNTRVVLQSGFGHEGTQQSLVPQQGDGVERGILVQGKLYPGNDLGWAEISAHGVNGNKAVPGMVDHRRDGWRERRED